MNSKNNQNKTLRGYVHNEKFGPYCMPVVFQNKLLKQYCDERKINFALPQGEIVFSKSFIQLRSLIEKLKHNEGIVMMSIFMLPQKSQDRNKILFNFINKKIECHFLFENVVAKNKKEYEYINNLINLNLYQKDNSKIFNWIKKNEIIKIS